MPNNDLISRASVLEALRELEKKMRIGWEYDSFCSGVVRATQLVECFQQAPAVTDSLSEELESLPKNRRYTIDCKSNGSYVVFSNDFPRWGHTLISEFWKTLFEAVLKLKQVLKLKGLINSNTQ